MVSRWLLRPSLVALVYAWAVAVGGSCAVSAANSQDIISRDEIVDRIGPRKPRSRGIAVVPDAGPGPAEATAPASEPRGMALPAIQFEFDSDRFTPGARRQVEELGHALLQPALRSFVFSVQGHTDSVGSAAYNRDLSARRASAVKRYLVDDMSVSADRLIEVGLGEGYPITGIPSDDERNRRVEVVNRGSAAHRPAATEDGTAPRPSRRALLVGIGEYRNFSRLAGAPNDATAMAEFLVGQGGFDRGDIRIVTDSDATRSNVLTVAQEWLVDGTAAGDDVVLFFSGHGFQQWDQDGDEADGMDETLVPVDAYLDGDGQVAGMITDDEIGALLDGLRGRRVWVVIDACHSGTSTRGVGVDESWRYAKTLRLSDGSPVRLPLDTDTEFAVETARAPANTMAKGDLAGVAGVESATRAEDPDLVVWTAVRANQLALLDREASGGTAGSVYTRRLLWGARDGRADADQDGTVTMLELHRYVQMESEAYCQRHPHDCKRGLTPQLEAMPSRTADQAFGFDAPELSRTAAFAKDILLQAADAGASSDGPGLRLQLEPGPKLEVGTEIEVVVESSRAGYLTVLDIDAAENLTQIFPNDESLRAGVSPQVRPGQPVRLPGARAGFRFQAIPPAGRGLLVAVVSDESVGIERLTGRHKDLAVVPSPRAYVVEASEALRVDDAAAAGGRGWRVGTLEYEILPPGGSR